MSMGLTPKQGKLLAFLREHEAAWDFAPTYREIMAELGWKSTSQVYERLQKLAERGHIQRWHDDNGNLISGAIEVVDHPVYIRGKRFRFIKKTHAGTPLSCGVGKAGDRLSSIAVPGRLGGV